jgi:hypothetical protein
MVRRRLEGLPHIRSPARKGTPPQEAVSSQALQESRTDPTATGHSLQGDVARLGIEALATFRLPTDAGWRSVTRFRYHIERRDRHRGPGQVRSRAVLFLIIIIFEVGIAINFAGRGRRHSCSQASARPSVAIRSLHPISFPHRLPQYRALSLASPLQFQLGHDCRLGER